MEKFRISSCSLGKLALFPLGRIGKEVEISIFEMSVRAISPAGHVLAPQLYDQLRLRSQIYRDLDKKALWGMGIKGI
jgi:hypothetical protein